MTNEELARIPNWKAIAEESYQIREKLAKKGLRQLMEDLEFSAFQMIVYLQGIENEDGKKEKNR